MALVCLLIARQEHMTLCVVKQFVTVVRSRMAAQQSQQQQQPPTAAAAPPSAPKTRLGLSLAERIKVIEARQMGKSMRQVVYQSTSYFSFFVIVFFAFGFKRSLSASSNEIANSNLVNS